MLSLKLSFMSAKDRANLNLFTVALFIICQATQHIVLSVQYFYLRRNKGPSVLSSARYKRVSIAFQNYQRLNIGNQYHTDVTQVPLGIIEKFEEPHNIFPHQTDETEGTTNILCIHIYHIIPYIYIYIYIYIYTYIIYVYTYSSRASVSK